MEGDKLTLAVAGGMLTILLGVGTIFRASLDRVDDRLDRTGEYIVTVNQEQWTQINANTKRLALIERELQIWKELYTITQPHVAGEDSYD